MAAGLARRRGGQGRAARRVRRPGSSSRSRPDAPGGARAACSSPPTTTASGRSCWTSPAEPTGGTLLDLVAGAEIVFESAARPATLAAAGIAEADLVAANARLVHVLVTPFGADGPARRPALLGADARRPRRADEPAGHPRAGAGQGVGAPGVAPCRRPRRRSPRCSALTPQAQTGAAQWIDVSAQAAMTWTMLNAMEADEIQGFDFERAGLLPVARRADPAEAAAPRTARLPASHRRQHRADRAVARRGGHRRPASWADEDWSTYDHRVLSGEDDRADLRRAVGASTSCAPATPATS